MESQHRLNNMKKILYIIEDTKTKSGLIVNSKNLLKPMKGEGFNIKIFNSRFVKRNSHELIRLLRKQIKWADIVHIHTCTIFGNVIYQSINVILELNKKCIVSLRGNINELNYYNLPKNHKATLSKLLKKTDVVITGVNEYQVKPILKYFEVQEREFEILRPGKPDEYKLMKSRRKIYDLVFIGPASKMKGLNEYLDVVKTMREVCKKNVVIISREDESEFKSYAKKLGISNLIEWHKEIPNRKVLSILNRSKILFLPTRAEAWPNAVIEAMFAKAAVVTNAVGGLPEILLDGELGYLNYTYKIKESIKSIDLLLSDQKILNNLTDKAYLHATKNYTLSTQMKKLNILYKYVLTHINN